MAGCDEEQKAKDAAHGELMTACSELAAAQENKAEKEAAFLEACIALAICQAGKP